MSTQEVGQYPLVDDSSTANPSVRGHAKTRPPNTQECVTIAAPKPGRPDIDTVMTHTTFRTWLQHREHALLEPDRVVQVIAKAGSAGVSRRDLIGQIETAMEASGRPVAATP